MPSPKSQLNDTTVPSGSEAVVLKVTEPPSCTVVAVGLTEITGGLLLAALALMATVVVAVKPPASVTVMRAV